MRGFVVCALLTLAIFIPSSVFGQEEPSLTSSPAVAQTSPLPLPSIILPSTPTEVPKPPIIPAPYHPVPSPLQPSELPTDYTLPPMRPIPDDQSEFIEFFADKINTTFDNGKPLQTIAEGNVIARLRDMSITSSRAIANLKTNIAVFEGNVVFKQGIQTVTGNRITINLKTREWSFDNAYTTIRPEFAQGYLLAPVFADGRRIWGLQQKEIFAKETTATTCNLSDPHYDLDAKSLAIYPDKKLVMRHVKFNALGHRLITLERFVVPLKQIAKNPQLIPKFGMTAEEGPFIKGAYPYMSTKTQTGIFNLDLMSRKGIGEGIRHTYQFSKASGDIQLYHIFDNNINEDTLTGKLSHNQKLGTINLNLASNFRSNSYQYAPQSKSILNQITLTRARPGANSAFIISQNINDAFNRTSQINSTLSHRQDFGARTFLNASFDYNAFNNSANTDAKLTSQMMFARQEDKFDWNLSAQKITDLSDEAFVGLGRFAGIEKLPELAIMSDTARLGNILPFGIPARFKFSYGKYDELPVNTTLDRAFLQIDSPAQIRKLSNTWSTIIGAGFRQYAYGDNTAQFSFDTSAELNKKLGCDSLFALTYRFQRPQGFTPFRFDYVGKYNVLNSRLDFKDSERFKLSVLSGYNFDQKDFPWQDATLRLSLQPTPSFLFYTATGYDINQNQWRTLINQIRIRAKETFRLDVGSRYDPTQGKLASIRTVLETPIDKKTRISVNAGYNGFTNNFDYRSFRLTRDLHCWEASVMYVDQGGFYNNNGFTFSLRIKAFPSYDEYGVGPFGAGLDTSVGNVYGY